MAVDGKGRRQSPQTLALPASARAHPGFGWAERRRNGRRALNPPVHRLVREAAGQAGLLSGHVVDPEAETIMQTPDPPANALGALCFPRSSVIVSTGSATAFPTSARRSSPFEILRGLNMEDDLPVGHLTLRRPRQCRY